VRAVIRKTSFCLASMAFSLCGASAQAPADNLPNAAGAYQGDAPLQSSQPGGDSLTIRVQSSLVLVDVLSQNSESGLPVQDLKKEDFRVFDNHKEVPIESFDSGAHFRTRPLLIWLAVICNERGKIGGSREFVGKESLFRPAFEYLDKRDIVGVAHWCDNGDARLDLLPTDDRDMPLTVLANTIKPIAFETGGNSNLVGEETYRKMVRLILQDAHHRIPQPLPVIVFLDGDHTAQNKYDLDQVVDEVLQTSGIVFGIQDQSADSQPTVPTGEIGNISHYMAEQTGGQYISAYPREYATAFETILAQLHFRYQLGFIPSKFDGKRHELNVELAKEAQKKYKGLQLNFRQDYFAPTSSH
jgi:hypothetical protein